MSRIHLLLTLPSLLALSSLLALPALGQTKAARSAEFIEFDGWRLDGQGRKPSDMYFDGRTRAKFDKLLSLKKSMRPALASTAADRALK